MEQKKHNQPFAELQHCQLRKKQFKKEKTDEIVRLIGARSPEVYKLLIVNKRSDTSPISAESWTLSTFNLILCNHKRALLTCYLDDPTCLHGISYSVTSYDPDKFSLLTLQSHPARWWQIQEHENADTGA